MANVIIVVPPAIKVRPTGLAPEIVTSANDTIGDVWPPGLIHNAKGTINIQGVNPVGATVDIEGVAQTVTAYGEWHIDITADVDHIEMGEATILVTPYVFPVSAWSAMTSAIVAHRNAAGAGSKTDLMVAAGMEGTTAETFDGTTWTSIASPFTELGANITQDAVSVGSASDFMHCQFQTTGAAFWDGSAWSSSGPGFMPTSAGGGGSFAGGTLTAAAKWGGGDGVGGVSAMHLQYNGTIWYTATNMSGPQYNGCGNGTVTTLLSLGLTSTGYSTESWDGTTWATEAQRPIWQPSDSSFAGSSAYAIITGSSGLDKPTDIYDGSVWSSGATIPIYRRDAVSIGRFVPAGYGCSTGGTSGFPTTETYEYDSTIF